MQEQEITLSDVLTAREERVFIQNSLLSEYRVPVISFTMNIAGPVKVTGASHRAFLWGMEQLRLGFVQNRLKVLKEYSRSLPTGDEGYFAVDAPARSVKSLCVEIEEGHKSLGRLFDMDVIGPEGKKLERGTERPCIVCGKPGRECASRRLHTVAELRSATASDLRNGLLLLDRQRIAALATRALLEEVAVTPKPGLVDRANNGSHRDMNYTSFQASAAALTPYWGECFLEGRLAACRPASSVGEADGCQPEAGASRIRHPAQGEGAAPTAAAAGKETGPSTPVRSAQDGMYETIAPSETFAALRLPGKIAERAMLAATGGVNTHKGVIFTLGVLCGAVGRLWTAADGFPDTDAILNEAAAMTRETLDAELPAARWNTAGEALYQKYGTWGIRGEVAYGLTAVRDISLPVFRKLVTEGLDRNHAAAVTLLHLIARVEDTNLLHRGGREGAAWARKAAEALLTSASEANTDAGCPSADKQSLSLHLHAPTLDQIAKLDRQFIDRNLSPGGCADLLAVTLFLDSLQSERDRSNAGPAAPCSE